MTPYSVSDITTRFNDFADTLKQGSYDSKKLIFHPELSLKPVKNLIKQSGELKTGENLLCLWNCPSFTTGDRMLLLTDKALIAYWKPEEVIVLKNRIELNDITSAGEHKEFLRVNGYAFFPWVKDKHNSAGIMLKMILEISGAAQTKEYVTYADIPILTEAGWPDVAASDTLSVLIFPDKQGNGEEGFYSRQWGQNLYEGYRHGSKLKMYKVDHFNHPKLVDILGLAGRKTPAVVLIINGKTLYIYDECTQISWEMITMFIDQTLDKLSGGSDAEKMTVDAAKVRESSDAFFQWQNAVTSGLAGGIIAAMLASFGVNRIVSLCIMLVAITAFVQNRNFNFTWLQRMLAYVLIFLIALYGNYIVAYLLSTLK